MNHPADDSSSSALVACPDGKHRRLPPPRPHAHRLRLVEASERPGVPPPAMVSLETPDVPDPPQTDAISSPDESRRLQTGMLDPDVIPELWGTAPTAMASSASSRKGSGASVVIRAMVSLDAIVELPGPHRTATDSSKPFVEEDLGKCMAMASSEALEEAASGTVGTASKPFDEVLVTTSSAVSLEVVHGVQVRKPPRKLCVKVFHGSMASSEIIDDDDDDDDDGGDDEGEVDSDDRSGTPPPAMAFNGEPGTPPPAMVSSEALDGEPGTTSSELFDGEPGTPQPAIVSSEAFDGEPGTPPSTMVSLDSSPSFLPPPAMASSEAFDSEAGTPPIAVISVASSPPPPMAPMKSHRNRNIPLGRQRPRKLMFDEENDSINEKAKP